MRKGKMRKEDLVQLQGREEEFVVIWFKLDDFVDYKVLTLVTNFVAHNCENCDSCR